MERLNFDFEAPYNALEASIHLARYAIVRHLCTGRRVLDIACGEGYGARFLAYWGAEYVDGVDISDVAIKNARRLFSDPRTRFHQHDAETVDALFPCSTFDLIVSLETIEHLRDPHRFLRALKTLLAPEGAIAISCQNDWWYYPSDSENNPFHVRKYRFEEFSTLAEEELGPPAYWGVGVPQAGFSNIKLADLHVAGPCDGQIRMMEARAGYDCYTMPSAEPGAPAISNCSYFFGFWGPVDHVQFGATIVPVSMDIFRNGMYAGTAAIEASGLRQRLLALTDENKHLTEENNHLTDGNKKLSSLLSNRDTLVRETRLHLIVSTRENQLMKQNISRLRRKLARLARERDRAMAELDRFRGPAARYARLVALLPRSLYRPLKRLLIFVRRAA